MLKLLAFLRLAAVPAAGALLVSSIYPALEPALAQSSTERDAVDKIAAAKTPDERRVLFEKTNDPATIELDHALLQRATSLQKESKFAEAVEFGRMAAEVAERAGDRAGLYEALNAVATNHRLLSDYPLSLEYCQKALAVAERLGDNTRVAIQLRGMGKLYRAMGNSVEALNQLQRSANAAQQAGDKQNMAQALLNLGAVYHDQSNYTEAMKNYNQSLKLAEEIKDRLWIAASFRNVGLIHFDQGDYLQARAYALKSLAISREVNDTTQIAQSLNDLGNAEQLLGRRKQALESYRESLKLAEQIGSKEDIANTLNNIGKIYGAEGDLAAALEHFQRALAIAEGMGDKHDISGRLHNMGDAYNQKGDYVRAAQVSERAVAVAREIQSTEDLAEALQTLGYAYRGLDLLDQAREAFAGAIAAVEEKRERLVGGAEEQQGYFSLNIGPYHGMIAVLADQHKDAEALTFAERIKARTLLDVLASGKANITRAMTGDEKQEEQKIDAGLSALNAKSINERSLNRPDPNRLAAIDAELTKARLERDAFRTSLYAAHPDLKIQRGQLPALALRDCAPLLAESNTALLEFVVALDETYLFVLTGRAAADQAPEVKLYKIDVKQKDLDELARKFRRQLALRDVTFTRSARKLYDLLLKPAAADLHKANLVVVPDGPLWEFPFQALQSAKGHYLVMDHAISYAPSLTALREMSRRHTSKAAGPPITLLAMGNPAIGGETASAIKSVMMDAHLGPLPQAEKQVQLLRDIYGEANSAIYIGAAATEGRLKAEAPRSRIIHLAAHAIFNDASPMYSQVVMSRDEGGSDDGVLEAWEVMDLDLHAEMVVLAACETARGSVGAGEGTIGLTWAFFVAGCASTVVSQWNVDAAGTTELMLEFHRNLKAGLTKPEALRRAELKLLTNPKYSDPFYWAPFVIVGAPNPIH